MGRRVMAGTFVPGDRVRVRDEDRPGHGLGHVRTPRYVRGKTGRVVATHGDFRDPESLAYGGTGLPEIRLYEVEFRQTDLWENYEGRPDDALRVDIFDHWLEPAREDAREEA